ncbi:1-phosphofructokinase family hexose kinase [Streptomyces sp. INA 01156]
MILTVTLNTALDITYRVPALRPHASHRVTEVIERPGGKGVNVARVLAALGHEVTVTGFAGGLTGRLLRDRLTPVPGLVDALVPVSGTTRRTVAVVDERSGATTQLNEPDPPSPPPSGTPSRRSTRTCWPVSRRWPCAAACPGRPGRRLRRAGPHRPRRRSPVLLDTSGAALRRGVAGRPDILKPNADELAELTGSHEPSRATRDARRRGAGAVVASLGPQGCSR